MPISPRTPLALGTLVLLAPAVSGIAPYDRATWLLEVAPARMLGGTHADARVRRTSSETGGSAGMQEDLLSP